MGKRTFVVETIDWESESRYVSREIVTVEDTEEALTDFYESYCEKKVYDVTGMILVNGVWYKQADSSKFEYLKKTGSLSTHKEWTPKDQLEIVLEDISSDAAWDREQTKTLIMMLRWMMDNQDECLGVLEKFIEEGYTHLDEINDEEYGIGG